MQIHDGAGSNYINLIRGKTTKNETVIRLDQDNDYFVSTKDPGFVMRTEHDGEWKWEPVSDFKKLQDFLKTATTKEKREQLGLWEDSKPFLGLFGKPDGIPQDKEVTPMGERWDKVEFYKEEKEYSSEYNQPNVWKNHYTQVVDNSVNVQIKEGINGTTATLEEPKSIMKTEIEYVTMWAQYCDGWRPYNTATHVINGNKF